MANTNAPFGFRRLAGTGTTPSYEQVTVNITSTTAAIYYGDPVARLSDGSIAGNTTSALPCCSTSVPLAGIFIGCKYLSTSQKKVVWSNYWPSTDVNSSSPIEGYIENDPNSQFLAQSAGSSSGLTQSMLGLLMQFNYNSTAVNYTSPNGLSAAYLDLVNTATGSVTGVSTGALLPFRLVGLYTPPANFGTYSGTPPNTYQTGAYNLGIVKFNNSEQTTTNAYL